MEQNNMITIIDNNGIEKQVEVLSYFTLNSNNKKYVAYTDNQVDSNNNVIVATSEVIENPDGTIEFANIFEPNVINEIKNVLIDLTK